MNIFNIKLRKCEVLVDLDTNLKRLKYLLIKIRYLKLCDMNWNKTKYHLNNKYKKLFKYVET